MSQGPQGLWVATNVTWVGTPDGEDPVDFFAQHFVDRTEDGAIGQARAWADAQYGPGAYEVVPS